MNTILLRAVSASAFIRFFTIPTPSENVCLPAFYPALPENCMAVEFYKSEGKIMAHGKTWHIQKISRSVSQKQEAGDLDALCIIG
jgi:hypothetical protein